ncbi:hypothetical protein BDN72DRAFT_619972 [Pluteus cervinus]|uniref:Uncharacterized protein n=1 Tax=Pluteus cervinus TaxID=181527 RepID=A0ACD3AU32_9AGAR|nr:hypothetical protein BDN72DRAFT_619972 [Pluteus cervinus]
MENLVAGFQSRGSDIFTDTEIRLKTRPVSENPTTARASGPSKDSTKSTTKRNSGKRKGRGVDHSGESGESDDELDLFSTHDPESDARSSVPPEDDVEDGVVIGGVHHGFHPDYGPERFHALKTLRFKKNKASTDDPSSTPKPPPPRVAGRSLAASSSTVSIGNNSDSKGANSSWDRSKRSPTTLSSPESSPSTDASHQRSSHHNSQSSVMPRASKASKPTQAVPRPFPGVGDSPPPPKAKKGSKADNKATKSSEVKSAAATTVKRRKNVILSEDDSESDSSLHSPDKKLKPAAFPMSSPLSTPPAPKELPLLSSLALDDKKPLRALNTQPSFCPLTAPSNFVKGKPGSSKAAKSKAPPSKASKAPQPRKPSHRVAKPKPFPMSSAMMSDSPPGASKAAKRLSEDSDGGSPRNKKRSKQAEAEIEPVEDDPFEGDSLFISPDTDPRTLCPYCDYALPSSPTPLLQKLLAETKQRSRSDARPANPLGRKAPLAVFINVCQRHNFESQILPEAEAKGWPKTIDWSALRNRIQEMREHLHDLIVDVVDPDMEDGLGCRSHCIFWKEVMAEVKIQGSRAATGVKGQFANFEKAQPGYYGELGSVIILQTLGDMFPLSSFDSSLVTPLTPKEFIQRILVPEVGVRLIMQDQQLFGDSGREDALQVLRDSTTYGVAMFPEGGSEWGDNHTGSSSRALNEEEGMDIADQIVMERARKRRKQLEAEGQWDHHGGDTEVESLTESESRKASKRKGKAKAVKKPSKDVVDITEGPQQPSRPRPRPVAKSASRPSPDSAPTVEPPQEEFASRPKPRPRPRPVSRAATPATEEDEPMPGSSPVRPKPKPRLRGPGADNAPSNPPRRVVSGGTDVDLNLCSSDSDASVKSSKSYKRKTAIKPKPKPTTSSYCPIDDILASSPKIPTKQKPKPTVASSYCPIDDIIASSPKTPRPRAVRSPSLEITSQNMVEDTPRPLKAMSSIKSASDQVKPLMIARSRVGKSGSQTESSTTTKPTQSSYRKANDGPWTFSMAVDSAIDVSDDSNDAAPGASKTQIGLQTNGAYSWLLDDIPSQ